jgi:hypothetical protein
MNLVANERPESLRHQAGRCLRIAQRFPSGSAVRVALEELANDLVLEADALEATAHWEAIPPSALISFT